MTIKNLRNKAAALCAAALLSFSIAPAPSADAGILDAVIGTAVMYQQVDSAMKYYDNDGRVEFMNQLKEQYGVNDDIELNARLDGIMANLTDAIGAVDPSIYDKPYDYFINPDKSFNAFCSLGHNMSVNTGMFNLVANDDEIAVVLGHEMGHGQKEHVRKSLKGSLNSQILGSVLGGAVGGTAGDLLGAVFANYAGAVHVTKPQEWEADKLSFEYLTHSGYNIGACAAIWERVIEQYGDNKQSFVGDIFTPSDHPEHGERRDKYNKMMNEYSGKVVDVEVNDKVKIGTVKINKKEFMVVPADDTMSSAERAYFVAGNLARAFHDGHGKSSAYADGTYIYLGDMFIVDAWDYGTAESLAARLNEIK